MIAVVSDLHLSEGRRSAIGKYSPNEDFFFDEVFDRFLLYLELLGSEPVHLIINGDFFDFLQVLTAEDELAACPNTSGMSAKEKAYICGYGHKTDQESAIAKLDKIAQGHPVFFEALGRFVAAGNKLTVVGGNHDVELFWPGVQRRFRELLRVEELATVAADGGIAHVDIEFAPWIYYDRDYSLYVEHGNQYESLNSFRNWLYPVLPRKRTEINLPVGSFFVRYFLNQVERINPFADNIKPNTKYVSWEIQNNPWGFRHLLKILIRFIITLAKTYRRSGRLSVYRAQDLIDFKEETDKRIKGIADRFGIAGDVESDAHPIRQLLRLQKMPINESKRQFLWRTFLSYIDVWFFLFAFAAAAFFMFSVLAVGISNIMSVISLTATALGFVAGNLFSSIGSSMSQANLEAVNGISRIFNDSGNPVKYITFGHTHEPEIAPVGNGGWYYNTGTWGVIFNEQEELIREKQQFAALVIDNPGAEPKLVRWNDNIDDIEPLPLFDSR